MGIRILILDDVVCARQLVKNGLEAAGHQVFESTSAQDAFKVFERETIDLIVADLHMASKEGFEYFDRAVKTARTPTFATTSGLEENYLRKAILYGFKEVLKKPLNFEHFGALIVKHCAAASNGRMVKIQAKVAQPVLEAIQFAAKAVNAPLEEFIGQELTKMFTQPAIEPPAPLTAEAADIAKANQEAAARKVPATKEPVEA